MPMRPVSRRRSAALVRPALHRRSLGGRVRHILVRLLLVLLLLPPALLLAYRVLPPPITPLMLLRLAEGEGLRKEWQPLSRIAVALPEAVVAAEDNRFCEHWGFDWPALEGEIESYLAGERPRGASTITMQTAKNLFLWPERSLLRKLLEAALTPQIALLWSKRRVIEVYLNIVEFGPGIYGAEAAAQSYFGKAAADLSHREAALLAAVLPSPRTASPARPSAYLQERAATISTRIEQLGPMLDCVREG
jgi:monofunctional biosynthetic peptidoglycan transglycosylase